MRISELKEMWDTISPLTGGFLLASADHPLSFHIGYSDGVKTFIVLNTGKIEKIDSSKALSVSVIQLKEEEYSLKFSLQYESLDELFIKLCWDLIEFTRDADNPVSELIDRYNNWLKLFQILREGLLSSSVQKGLIGELMQLNELIDEVGEDEALISWVGPEGSDQDFNLADKWIEVKAVTIAANDVWITSLQQLDRNDPGRLAVFFMDKTSSNGSNTVSLYSAYNNVASRLVSDTNKDILSCKIARYGLTEDELQKYEESRYSFSEKRMFEVVQSFPRLTRQNTPVEVSGAKYSIDLSTIEPYRLKES